MRKLVHIITLHARAGREDEEEMRSYPWPVVLSCLLSSGSENRRRRRRRQESRGDSSVKMKISVNDNVDNYDNDV